MAGDPVEVNSLGRFFMDATIQKKRYIGSVKTNIGHLESGAGVAGLIKVVLMMKNNKIVESLLTGDINPRIDWEKYCFEVPTNPINWDRDRKLACVNSFGFGGSNCHAVLSAYIGMPDDSTEHKVLESPLLFCFSGQDQQGLQQSIQEFTDFAETESDINMTAVSYTSTVRRDHFSVRKAVTAKTLKELMDKLKPGIILQKYHRYNRVIFVFGGMGVAWVGMCKELMSRFQVFKHKIQEIDNCLKQYVSWSLVERLLGDYDVEDTMYGPIVTFACQVALVTLWNHLGVKPDCVVGQSIGEVAASHVAGIWSLSEAVNIIFHRTNCLAKATGGKMLLIRNYHVDEIEKMLIAYESKVNIGLYYSPKSCVISGDVDDVDQIEKDLLTSPTEQKHGITVLMLQLKTAFHSHHTEDSKLEIQKMLVHMQGCNPHTEIISTVSGVNAEKEDFLTAEYWGKNIREPVQFGKAVSNAAKENCFNIFLEIGPRPVLGSHIKDLIPEDHSTALPSMKKDSELNCLLETAGKMYEFGVNLKWDALYDEPQQNTEYPKYSFCTKRSLFISEEIRQELMGMDPELNLHPFLKTIFYNGANCEHKIIVSPTSISSVYEHRFYANILIPGALYAEAGFALARHYFNRDETQDCSISMTFIHPVVLMRGKTTQLDVDVTTTDLPESFMFVVRDQNSVYAEGKVKKEDTSEDVTIDIDSIKMRCKQRLSKEDLYNNLRNLGLTFGDMLQLIGDTVKNDTEVLSELSLNTVIKNEMKETIIHPAILDALFHSTASYYSEAADKQKALPVQVKNLMKRQHVEDKMYVYTKFVKATKCANLFHISLISTKGHVIVEIEKFITKKLGSQNEQTFFEMQWLPTEKLLTRSILMNLPHKWLIISDKELDAAAPDYIKLEYISLEFVENVSEMLQAIREPYETWSAVVFCCRQQMIDGLSGESVLQLITRQIMNLRDVLLYLRTHNANIPLFIVTENAVNIGNSSTAVDPIGGSCWGFVRSVLREQVYKMTTIVDLHTAGNNNFDTLLTVTVGNLLTGNHHGLNEFVVEGNYIWCNHMFSNYGMQQYRNNKLDKQCIANLMSMNKNGVYKPYLQNDNQKRKPALPDLVEMMTSKAVMHSSSLYQQCTHDSYIITLEATGQVSSLSGSLQNVVCFFPCKISTFITVPTQCIIELNRMPCYEPGLLTKLFVLWIHCVSVDNEVNVLNEPSETFQKIHGECCKRKQTSMEIIIIFDDATQPVANALLLMLESMQSNANIISVDMTNPALLPRYDKAVIVSTIQLDELTVEAMCRLWPNSRLIVCLDQLLPEHATLHISHINIQLEKKIIRASYIFTPKLVMSIMPQLVEWIVQKYDIVTKITQILQGITVQQTDSTPKKTYTNIAKLMQSSTFHFSSNDKENIKNILATEDMLLRPDGVYIVVGGLTGLGWECVQFLARRGAGAVVIINRRKAQNDSMCEIEKIKKDHGSQISVIRADVTSMESLKITFETIENIFPTKQLKGIYFGAGVLEDKILMNMSRDSFLKVAAPKIQGAWNMHLFTQTKPLDFFIMHSSVTAVFGTPGQCNYGAANAFQDSLAHKRRQAGLVGQSINWGPLDLGMLLEKPEVKVTLEEQGYTPLSVDDIQESLLATLMLDNVTIIAAKFNSIKLANSITNENNMNLQFKFRSIFDISTLEIFLKDSLSSNHHIDVEQLKAAESDTRWKTISDYIAELLTDVLSLSPGMLDSDRALVNLGLDSMQAMMISNQINEIFGVRITPNGLLDQNISVTRIAELINTGIMTFVNKPPILDISSSFSLETLTFMEYTFYKIYSKKTTDPSLYYVNEISLPETVAKPEIWKKIADQLMSRHEVLRTTFTNVDEGEHIRWNVKRKINSEMKPDFILVQKQDIDEIEKRTTQAFDLERQGPLRFIYIIGNGKKSYLRTVYNSIGFDMQTISVIFKDVFDIFLSNHHIQPLKELHSVGGSLIVVEMEKVLQEKGQALRDFWKQLLGVNIPTICLGTEELKTVTSKKYLREKVTLAPDVYNKLFDIIKSIGLSMFKLMTSVYQLLLHLMTNERNVAISTTVDVKQYIPNVATAVGLGTNYIPLLAKFPSDDFSVEEFLQNNKAALQDSIDHCVCPLDIISEVVGSEKITNIIRNKVVIVEDEFMTPLLRLAHHAGYIFNVTKSEDLGTHTETQFTMWNKTKEKQIIFELIYDSNAVSQTRAKDVIRAFEEILIKISSDISVTTQSLRHIDSIKKLRGDLKQNEELTCV